MSDCSAASNIWGGGLPEGQRVSIPGSGVTVWDEATVENWRSYGTSTATRTVVCYWTERLTLVNDLMASTGLNAANQYVYNPQSPYPAATNTLFLADINCVGIPVGGLNNDAGNLVGYKYARVQLIYKSLPYNYGNLNIQSMDYSVEEMVVPNNTGSPTFFFTTSGNTPDFVNGPVLNEQIPSVRVSTMTLVIQQFYCPILPISQVTNVIGKVNGSQMTLSSGSQLSVSGFANASFAKETLLFEGAKSNRRIALANDGQSLSDMSFTFRYNPQGWQNRIKQGANPIFQRIVDANGNPPFAVDKSNFASLGIFQLGGIGQMVAGSGS